MKKKSSERQEECLVAVAGNKKAQQGKKRLFSLILAGLQGGWGAGS